MDEQKGSGREAARSDTLSPWLDDQSAVLEHCRQAGQPGAWSLPGHSGHRSDSAALSERMPRQDHVGVIIDPAIRKRRSADREETVGEVDTATGNPVEWDMAAGPWVGRRQGS